MADPRYSFVTGSSVRPYSPSSTRAVDLLDSMTDVELASCVPYLRIRQVDAATRQPLPGDGIMAAILSPPTFGDALGRSERPEVSLESVVIKSNMSWGTTTTTTVDIAFVVHRPEAVFSVASPSPWRSLLVEGNVFQLDFGWSGNTTNELFNGVGYFDRESGFSTPSRRSLIFLVPKYDFDVTTSGEMRFTVHAIEAYDIGLRQLRVDTTRLLPPTGGVATGPNGAPVEDLGKGLDQEQVKSSLERLLATLDGRTIRKGRAVYNRFGDVFDLLVVPQLRRFIPLFGYASVSAYVGNFNPRAGRTNKDFGDMPLGGASIAEFPVPRKVLRETLARFVMLGQKMNVDNFVSHLVNLMNAAPWMGAQREGANVRVPSVKYRVTSVERRDSTQEMVFTVFDEHEGSAPFDAVQDAMRFGTESRAEVLRKVRDQNVPIVSFGRGSTLVRDNSFQVIQDELMRSIMVEKSMPDRDLRTSIVPKPDPAGRRGGARSQDLIQLGHVQGTLGMRGNFVFDMFAAVWIDFFEATEFSGLFTVRGVQHDLRAGQFNTTVEVISAGDPLNTRRRLSGTERSP